VSIPVTVLTGLVLGPSSGHFVNDDGKLKLNGVSWTESEDETLEASCQNNLSMQKRWGPGGNMFSNCSGEQVVLIILFLPL
jgi:hypothetical protein